MKIRDEYEDYVTIQITTQESMFYTPTLYFLIFNHSVMQIPVFFQQQHSILETHILSISINKRYSQTFFHFNVIYDRRE